jgi:uncharacterized membrane protein
MGRAIVAAHVFAGIVAVISGAAAMFAAKGSPRHRLGGKVFCSALSVLVVTATALASVDWPARWVLFVLGVASFALAGLGYSARLIRWRGWIRTHILGMGGAYIAMLTAFYVDNGPRLPLWRLLPPIAFWFLPSAIGLPLLVRAMVRADADDRLGRVP